LIWIVRLLRADGLQRSELEATLKQNRFLLREVHHRVKNNLQTVASLVRLQPLPPEARASISGRIEAMSAVHEQIYGSDQYDKVSVAPYLERLIDRIVESHNAEVAVQMNIAAIELDRDKAMQLGLIVNEVISNALKHAFPGRADGRMTVDLGIEGSDVRLVVSDDGVGYPPDTTKKNMGSKLVEGFAAQLNGRFEITTGRGTTFSLSFPTN
jgi:two-component sensor histidine kinase